MWGAKRLILVAVGAIALISVIALFAKSRPGEAPSNLEILGATKGGTYFVVAEDLARILRNLRDEPIEAKSTETSGSFSNVRRLTGTTAAGDADGDGDEPRAHIALVSELALQDLTRQQKRKIRVLSYLYRDIVQLVVRKDRITSLADLKDKNIYVGKPGSSTEPTATAMLDAILGVGNYTPRPTKKDLEDDPDGWGYSGASKKLVDGEIDAAIFAAGPPTTAVKDALESKSCALMSLDPEGSTHLADVLLAVGKLAGDAAPVPLHARFYENQENEITTVGTRVFLVCRADLPDDYVARILDGLFDNMERLLSDHTPEEIRLHEAFPRDVSVEYHAGARQFEKDEKKKLRIATGPVGGTYFTLGRELADLLDQEGIDARVIHTHASVENARLLADEQPTLAIMQYDIALAALFGNTAAVYGENAPRLTDAPDSTTPLQIELRRLAVLHEERVFILMRRDSMIAADAEPGSIAALEDLTVGVGPEDSGNRHLAEAILRAHGLSPGDPAEERWRYLTVDVMVRQLEAGLLDAGIFVSGLPSDLLKTLLRNPVYRLLSIDPKKVESLLRKGTLSKHSIWAGRFACQHPGEGAVTTLSTRAVLVTTEDEDAQFDVAAVTRAIFGGAGLLSIVGNADTLRSTISSVALHPDAKAVYQDLGYAPPPPHEMSVLEVMAHVLAILVIVIGTASGTRKLWRDHISDRIKSRMLEIAVDASNVDSARRLRDLRAEARQRARLQWWHPSQLDRSRWHDLEQMIDQRIQEAWVSQTRKLAERLRQVRNDDGTIGESDASRLRDEAWRLAEAGELGAEQLQLVLQRLAEFAPPTPQAIPIEEKGIS